MAEEEKQWNCIVQDLGDAAVVTPLYNDPGFRTSKRFYGTLEAAKQAWTDLDPTGKWEQLLWLEHDEYMKLREELGAPIMFPQKWLDFIAKRKAESAPIKSSCKKREPDKGPLYWELRDEHGNLKLNPDDVMAAVRASSSDPKRIGRT